MLGIVIYSDHISSLLSSLLRMADSTIQEQVGPPVLPDFDYSSRKPLLKKMRPRKMAASPRARRSAGEARTAHSRGVPEKAPVSMLCRAPELHLSLFLEGPKSSARIRPRPSSGATGTGMNSETGTGRPGFRVLRRCAATINGLSKKSACLHLKFKIEYGVLAPL